MLPVPQAAGAVLAGGRQHPLLVPAAEVYVPQPIRQPLVPPVHRAICTVRKSQKFWMLETCSMLRLQEPASEVAAGC